ELAPLAGLTVLQWLNLGLTRVTELAPLAGLTALQWLNLGQTRVTELAPLAGLTALQELYLYQTPVASDENELKTFRQAHPKCKVFIENPET
ncbi:MAG: hypothetical protein O7G85_17205, partial [Planctomycetota bacterium]|nr:hypothetical protein [Planctomycetota bacterium]